MHQTKWSEAEREGRQNVFQQNSELSTSFPKAKEPRQFKWFTRYDQKSTQIRNENEFSRTKRLNQEWNVSEQKG